MSLRVFLVEARAEAVLYVSRAHFFLLVPLLHLCVALGARRVDHLLIQGIFFEGAHLGHKVYLKPGSSSL